MDTRTARAEDAEAFVRAHEEGWDATIAPLAGRPLAELAPFEQRVAAAREGLAAGRSDARAFVAEHEGAVVGVAVAVGDELRDLYVVPAAWGTGTAAALAGAALDFLRSLGVRRAVLWVGEENARARRFYEREGWSADGGRRSSPLGPAELRYARPLDHQER